MKIGILFSAFALVFVAGCGGGDGDDDGFTYSCSWKDSSGSNAGTCIYYSISIASSDMKQQVEQICTVSNGVYGEGPCPGTGLLGRCIQFEGTEGEVSNYYYTNFKGSGGDPKQTAKSRCAALPGRWEDLS
jgi:hypothetical protein